MTASQHSPVTVLLAAMAEAGPARALGGVPYGTPAYGAEWLELGADSVPVERAQIAIGGGFGDILAAALAAEARAGRVLSGRVVDLRTAEILAEYPATA